MAYVLATLNPNTPKPDAPFGRTAPWHERRLVDPPEQENRIGPG